MKKEYTIGWEQKCSGCGHHSSFHKTIVESPQWFQWEAYQREHFGSEKGFQISIENRESARKSNNH
jgi:hypothetical protein